MVMESYQQRFHILRTQETDGHGVLPKKLPRTLGLNKSSAHLARFISCNQEIFGQRLSFSSLLSFFFLFSFFNFGLLWIIWKYFERLLSFFFSSFLSFFLFFLPDLYYLVYNGYVK